MRQAVEVAVGDGEAMGYSRGPAQVWTVSGGGVKALEGAESAASQDVGAEGAAGGGTGHLPPAGRKQA